MHGPDIGVAVHNGVYRLESGIQESVGADIFQRYGQLDRGQRFVAAERLPSDLFDALAQRESVQIGALGEGFGADPLHGARDDHLRQVRAAIEGPAADVFHARGNGDFGDGGVVHERPHADAADGLAVDLRGNGHLAFPSPVGRDLHAAVAEDMDLVGMLRQVFEVFVILLLGHGADVDEGKAVIANAVILLEAQAEPVARQHQRDAGELIAGIGGLGAGGIDDVEVVAPVFDHGVRREGHRQGGAGIIRGVLPGLGYAVVDIGVRGFRPAVRLDEAVRDAPIIGVAAHRRVEAADQIVAAVEGVAGDGVHAGGKVDGGQRGAA